MKSKPLVIALVLVALASACSGDGEQRPAGRGDTTTTDLAESPATTSPASQPLECDDEIVVGVVTDLSGGLSLYGDQLARGVAIGFAHAAGETATSAADQVFNVDGCEIRMLLRDDQSNPQFATVAAGELIDKGASILIGSASPGTTEALRQLAIERAVALIATTDTTLGLAGADFDPRVFLIGPSVHQDAMAICSFLVEDGDIETVAQIAPDYAYGHRAADAYRSACTSAGASFVASDVMVPAVPEAGFDQYLEPLVAAPPDVLLVTWNGGGLASLTETATQLLGADTALATPFPPNQLTRSLLSEAVGSTSSIAYHYTVPGNDINQALIDQAGAVFDVKPDLYDAVGMNASLMLLAALRATGGVEDSLLSGLEGVEFEGPKGAIAVRAEDHVAVQDMFIVTLLNTEDSDEAFYEYRATVRPTPPCLLNEEFTGRCGRLAQSSPGG